MPTTTAKVNNGHFHEALDRTFIIQRMTEEFLLSNPAVAQNKKWKTRVNDIIIGLEELYQEIGADDRTFS